MEWRPFSGTCSKQEEQSYVSYVGPHLPPWLGRWKQDDLNLKVMSATQGGNKASLFCMTLLTFTLETGRSFVWFPLAIMKVPGQHTHVLGPHLVPHVSQSCMLSCFRKDSIRPSEMCLSPLLNLPLSKYKWHDPQPEGACKLHSDRLATLAETRRPSAAQVLKVLTGSSHPVICKWFQQFSIRVSEIVQWAGLPPGLMTWVLSPETTQ